MKQSPNNHSEKVISFTDAQIIKIAGLARLHLTDEERRDIAKDLSVMLDYVATLSQVNTENVPVTTHPTILPDLRREDKITEGLSLKNSLKNAPQSSGDHFAVPTVIE